MRYFEDFTAGEIIVLGTYTVTKAEIIEFGTRFDPQPFHVDEEKAKESPIFQGLVASGWHTGSIFMRLFADGILKDSSSQGAPGIDELRWPTPVRPGDTLTARITILEKNESKSRPNLGITKIFSEMFNQNGETVLTMRSVGFFLKKPL
jgi:acyl dehydratase